MGNRVSIVFYNRTVQEDMLVLGVRSATYVKAVCPLASIACLMYVFVWFTRSLIDLFALPELVELASLVSAGMAVFLALITTFQRDTWNDLLQMFRPSGMKNRLTAVLAPLPFSKFVLSWLSRRRLHERYRLWCFDRAMRDLSVLPSNWRSRNNLSDYLTRAKRTDIKSILLLGAGPIVIGRACEVGNSGTQAWEALREEGYRVNLVNSNPAILGTTAS